MCVFTGCGTTEIDLNQYVEVLFSGYDTFGGATLNNKSGLEQAVEDYWEIFGLTESQVEDGDYDSSRDAYQFLESIAYSLDKTPMLSNGDTVTVVWTVEEDDIEELEKELKVKFEYSDMEFTVEGLEQAVEWDPFEAMIIETSPSNGRIIRIYNPEVPNLSYQMDAEEYGNLNGDIITVSINSDEVFESCNLIGLIPTTLSTEIELSGFDEYVSEVSQLSDELYAEMDINVQTNM